MDKNDLNKIKTAEDGKSGAQAEEARLAKIKQIFYCMACSSDHEIGACPESPLNKSVGKGESVFEREIWNRAIEKAAEIAKEDKTGFADVKIRKLKK